MIAQIVEKIKDLGAKMRLLVYRWGSVSEPLFCEALKNLGIEYKEYAKIITNHHSDAVFAQEMIEIIHKENIGMVYSFDYFPLVAMICEINKIPYVSWIYDCPQYTLLSKTLVSPYNYIFCFDRVFAERLKAMGAVHCEHYPLAGDTKMLERAFKKEETTKEKYVCDISFIGNLYNDEKNRFRKVNASCEEAAGEVVEKQNQTKLSSYTAGFAEGLIQSQQQIYGYNFIKEALQEQPEVVEELVEKCQLTLGAEFVKDDLQMAADVLGMEVSAREREDVLELLSKNCQVRLYTSSDLPKSLKNNSLEKMGYADYETELPLIYHHSKINLNITSKTIESGIPQRVFDILGCGGFCLTNYQPEVAEYFEDGKELVMYTSMEDLLLKTIYYLEHEEERAQIAKAGHRKIAEYYKLEERVHSLLGIVKRSQEACESQEIYVKTMELKERINICLAKGEIAMVQELLLTNKSLLEKNNDLANMYYLSNVCDKERKEGRVTAYKDSWEETTDIFYKLQRMLRRLEWWEEFEREEIYTFLEEKDISVYELQWAVMTACVDKEKVWRLLGE